ncbi:MAG: ribonuclease [Variibacter sp.]|jgi:ribonuclease E|nr:ribonuclease [Variibacter sp.]
MANKMLIDSTHPEETRVVVVRGNRVEEFDFESANRRQLRGNIYLAKVTRVEPSLQAAFVEYGGNRHGFLAFSEIHPDYYQIPVADRQALLDEDARAHRAAEDDAERHERRPRGRSRSAEQRHAVRRSEEPGPEGFRGELQTDANSSEGSAESGQYTAVADGDTPESAKAEPTDAAATTVATESQPANELVSAGATGTDVPEATGASAASEESANEAGATSQTRTDDEHEEVPAPTAREPEDAGHDEEEIVESVGGADALEEVQDRVPRFRRQYKIQEVIKRRQVMLVQVVKEERGTKGAALTTYLSLAGRYSVLMPNTARGGGISRKITNAPDRKRLKEVAQELEVPEGMGVILRTAGANRTKAEIKRDFEYLLRTWEAVRDLTLKSAAPMLVYEEGSLIKRAIRDLYNKDIDEVIVAGDDGYREAKDFMRMLMPSHAKNVQPFKDTQPLFTRQGIESQLDAMFSPIVQLRSGGYIVLNQTEALVAIDVNSGRATREHHIEDTALKTNLEAAEEVARQLRLRDLAGLIVIDFIDMDENRNNRAVERKLKDCLKHDRARIQVGRISHFGLLEMSRQRIRSSMLESSTEKCAHCGGTGHVRSVSSVTLQLLRSVEEMLLKAATHNLIVRTRSDIALYVLNHKRAHLRDLETRFLLTVTVTADAAINGQQPFVIERGEQVHSPEAAKALAVQPVSVIPEIEEETDESEAAAVPMDPDIEPGTETETTETDQAGRKRRRRRRRGRGRSDQADHAEGEAIAGTSEHEDDQEEEVPSEQTPPRAEADAANEDRDGERRRRRRGRRGGRRNRGERGQDSPDTLQSDAPSAEHVEQGEHSVSPETQAERPSPEQPQVSPEAFQAVVAERTPRSDREVPQPEPTQIAEHAPAGRRSTVREPAPAAMEADTLERDVKPARVSREPVSSEPEVESQSEGPKKAGWWSRKVFGRD